MKHDFNHKIEIHGTVKRENIAGEETESMEKLKSVWAQILPQTGSLQKQQAETILTNVTHKIIIRYSAAPDLTINHQIHFRRKQFDIRYILNPFFKNETLEIFVQEVIT